jgi:predicted O-methyltransferase YrrM
VFQRILRYWDYLFQGQSTAEAKRRILLDVLARSPTEGVLVEVGCLRSEEDAHDGASTLVLGQWARDHSQLVHSIDVDSRNISLARSVLNARGLASYVRQWTGTGQQVLAQLDGPIAFLYLDGSDNPDDTLEQVQAAYHQLLTGARVIIDDCHAYRGNKQGKGTHAIPHLEDRGWSVTYHRAGKYRMAELQREE